MAKPAHKNHTKDFADLTFSEQAKSITASINNLQNSITHHIEHSPKPDETRKKCLQQMHRCIGRLIERTLVLMLLLALIGCGGGASPESSARSQLESKLDVWISGNSGTDFPKAIDEVGAVLLDYDIKTFNRDADGTEALLYKEGDWYRATVNLTFQSRAGTEIKKQHQWVVYRENADGPWKFKYDILRG